MSEESEREWERKVRENHGEREETDGEIQLPPSLRSRTRREISAEGK
jgi:hypothetical protein